MNRRSFIRTAIGGVAGVLGVGVAVKSVDSVSVDPVSVDSVFVSCKRKDIFQVARGEHLIDWEFRIIPTAEKKLALVHALVRKKRAEYLEELVKAHEENLWGDKITPAR